MAKTMSLGQTWDLFRTTFKYVPQNLAALNCLGVAHVKEIEIIWL